MSSKECKWEIFFCTHPRFKEQFANIDKELSDLFAENDEWGNLLLQHPIWFDMIFSKDNPGVAKFFSTRINWAKLFFLNDKWYELFYCSSKQLIIKFDDKEWSESLKNPNWLKLFANNPGLFLDQPAWFELIKEISNNEPYSNFWIEELVNTPGWEKKLKDEPEFALVYALELVSVQLRRSRNNIYMQTDVNNLVGLAFSGGRYS